MPVALVVRFGDHSSLPLPPEVEALRGTVEGLMMSGDGVAVASLPLKKSESSWKPESVLLCRCFNLGECKQMVGLGLWLSLRGRI